MKRRLSVLSFLTLGAIALFARATGAGRSPYVIVLGIAQDGGIPQTGTKEHRGWTDKRFRRLVTCLGIVDEDRSQRWMIDATPDFPEQLHLLDDVAPVEGKPGLDGIFLTHAHIGHYTGLMHLGYEVMGARSVPVYAMPKMVEFLGTNGPWDQLVRYQNIELRKLENGVPVKLSDRITVTPLLVPHRQEYTEVVGFRVQGPNRSVLFIPDIDQWEDWDASGTRIEDELAKVDVAYLDGSFFANGEIPGRDMTGFPHPLITHSMERFEALPAEERDKIRFIHLNHTNPAIDAESAAAKNIKDNGFRIAEEKERVEL